MVDNMEECSKAAIRKFVYGVDSEVEAHILFNDSNESLRIVLQRKGNTSVEIRATMEAALEHPPNMRECLEEKLRCAIVSIQ